jgi:hypothetical protein
MQMACDKITGDQKIRHMAANLTCDFLVDEYIHQILGDATVEREKIAQERISKGDLNKLNCLRTGVYNLILDAEIIPWDAVPNESRQIQQILAKIKNPIRQAKEICEIIVSFMDKNKIQPQDIPDKMCEDEGEKFEKQDDAQTYEELMDEDYSDPEEYKKACKVSKVKEDMHYYYLGKARNKIRYQASSSSMSGGYREPRWHINWDQQDSADIDLQASMQENPILLPDTVLMPHYEIGYTTHTQHPSQLLFILDVSGSMPEETAIVTIYSLLESAKNRGIPAGVIAFSEGVTYASQDISNRYEEMEKGILKGYAASNTLLTPALRKAQEMLYMQPQTLVIIASDMGLADAPEADREVQNMPPQHPIHLIIIEPSVAVSGAFAAKPQTKISSPQELANAAIGEVNSL